MRRRSRSLLAILVLTGAALSVAHAAELGEARVSSHIGQQLVADIELSMVEDPAAQVAVRVASAEVYRGAGIALPPVLPSLNLAVMRRDGRQFLHVTSLRPVDADHLHLYLELADKGQRVVRLATLWLTPDPNPAPPPAPVPVPVPVPVSVAPTVAAAAPLPRPAPRPAPVAAPVRAHAAAPAPAPAGPPATPAAKPAAPPPAERKKPLLVLPIHKPVKPAALHADSQPPACTPDEAQACTALGTRNAALREQLAKLEEKVKGLQKVLGVTPSPAAALAPAAATHEPDAPKAAVARADPHATGEHEAEDGKTAEHKPDQPRPGEHKQEEHKPDAPAETKPPEAPPAPPPAPKPISSIKPLVPHKPKAAPQEEGSAPWAWIAAGIALLAAAGGGAFVWKRRAAGKSLPVTAPATAVETEQKVAEPTME